jgi:hypothetical protein
VRWLPEDGPVERTCALASRLVVRVVLEPEPRTLQPRTHDKAQATGQVVLRGRRG